MKIRAIAFDLYGTLIEDFPIREHRRILIEIAELLGVHYVRYAEEWKSCYLDQEAGRWDTASDCIREIGESTGAQLSSDSLGRAISHLHSFTQSTFRVRNGTANCLAQLRILGYGLCLISNCPPEVPECFEQCSLAEKFDAALFSCREACRKPDRAIYASAAKRLGLSPSEILFVGDGGAYELQGARSAEMRSLLVRGSGCEFDRLGMRPEAKSWAGPRIESIEELLPWIEQDARADALTRATQL